MMRAILLSLMLAAPAVAQQTASDILAALEQPADEMRQLTEILTGPDEEKALSAMRLMLVSGDPALERLALRAGLTSTSGVVRGVALSAFLDGKPTLVAFAETQVEEPAGFQRWIEAVGSLNSQETGSFAITVGPPVEDAPSCYGSLLEPGDCRVRIGGTELSFYVGSAWGSARLNENGELVGGISNAAYKTGPITLRIPLLGQLQ